MPDNNTSRGVRSRRGRLSAAIDAERQARLEQSFISFDETVSAMSNVLATSGGEALTQATLESALQSLRNQPGMSIRPTQVIVDESSCLGRITWTNRALLRAQDDVTPVRIDPALLDRLTPEQRAAYDAAANGIPVQQVLEITDRNGNRMLLNEAGQEAEDL